MRVRCLDLLSSKTSSYKTTSRYVSTVGCGILVAWSGVAYRLYYRLKRTAENSIHQTAAVRHV